VGRVAGTAAGIFDRKNCQRTAVRPGALENGMCTGWHVFTAAEPTVPMVVDPSEAKQLGADEEDAPSTWRGRLKRWVWTWLPVKY
jgi:hypothetical protein